MTTSATQPEGRQRTNPARPTSFWSISQPQSGRKQHPERGDDPQEPAPPIRRLEHDHDQRDVRLVLGLDALHESALIRLRSGGRFATHLPVADRALDGALRGCLLRPDHDGEQGEDRDEEACAQACAHACAPGCAGNCGRGGSIRTIGKSHWICTPDIPGGSHPRRMPTKKIQGIAETLYIKSVAHQRSVGTTTQQGCQDSGARRCCRKGSSTTCGGCPRSRCLLQRSKFWPKNAL